MKIRTDVFFESYEKHKNNPLGTLIGFYKGYYHYFFFSTITYVIKHSPTWVLPVVTANIINYITGEYTDVFHLVLLNAGILALLYIINLPMNYLHVHFRSKAIRNVEAGLRSTLVHKIQQLSIPYQKDMESGRLQSKIIRDVEAVETLSSQLFVSLLNIIINISVAMVVTILRSKIVFIFFVLMVPLAAVLVITFKKPIKKHNQKFRKEMEQASAEVMEMVELVPVTRAHALEEEEIRKMDYRVNEIAKEGYELDMIQANFGAVSWVCFQIFQVVCLVFTAYLAIRKDIPTGDVVLYQSYFTTIVGQVSSLLNLLPTISKGLESVNSIGEVLLSEEIEDDAEKEIMDDLKGGYDFRNLSYTYPKSGVPVLQKVNLEIKPHETVAFVGESGAGKTTMINLILGFCMATEGSLAIDGKNIENISLRSYRRFLAVVPQETVLFGGSIRDNILYGTTDISEERLEQVIDEAGLRTVIRKLPQGLDTLVGERGDKLSGGQKQRISIARALIRDPKVIILDEATSALDAISEREVSVAIENLTKDRTTFMVAHRLQTIQGADKIVVMKEGEIKEMGTFEELLDKKGYFYKMYIENADTEG
ncbi:MAG: ABC transporter ATP-binding protein/permease [Lachnospiraceae bacterium]|nr:ABC transporter ATP-binding protein/permease [Lachnospiraceae bacterium]